MARSDDIRTSTDTTDASGVNTCCTLHGGDARSIAPRLGWWWAREFQFMDPLGIHVVPEVRYTRWENPIFDNLTTTMRGNQLEATISLTF